MSLFIWLRVGIYIDTFTYDKYSVNRLYIKLDKKLTFVADNLTIPKSKKKTSFDHIEDMLDTVKYILTFFNKIKVEKINFKDNTMSILFQDDILKVESDEYIVEGNVFREGKILKIDIPMLKLKKEHITLKSKIVYDLAKDRVKSRGTFSFYDIKGNFKLNKYHNSIDFEFGTNRFKSVKKIVDKMGVNRATKEWMLDKIKAKKYKLIYCKGKGKIENEKFVLNKNSLKADMLFSNVNIFFHKKLAPVKMKDFHLHFANQGLVLKLNRPSFKKKSMKGSKVSIVDIWGKNPLLHLDGRFHIPFDDTIQSILKAYKIDVPLEQQTGKGETRFQATIGLSKYYRKYICDVSFKDAKVKVRGIPISLTKGKIHYTKGSVAIEDVYLKDDMYEGKLHGKLNLNMHRAKLVFDAKKIVFKDNKEKLFYIKDKKLPINIYYKNGLDVSIPKLSLRIKSGKKITKIKIKNLNKIKPYLLSSSAIEDGGEIEIKTKDFERYRINGVMFRRSCFFYTKENICEAKIPFYGTINGNEIDIYAFKKRVHFKKSKNTIYLNAINIDLKKLLAGDDNKDQKKDTVHIIGTKSHIRYENYRLLMDSYIVNLKSNGDIYAHGKAGGDKVSFSKKGDKFYVKATRIKDKILHPLINFRGLKQGRYSLKKSGNPEKIMRGEIVIEGGVMKDFKAYNNALAFINTIPALAMLQNPGYSKKGFTIKKGFIKYSLIKHKKVYFDAIHIVGESATIVGKGILDLKKKTIKINLAIRVGRTLGKMVGKIPLLGYILMGKDKSITVGLKITGTYDNPKVETSATKDILSLPYKLIKRTLKSGFR